MKVKEESKKVGLKFNIQKMKMMASGPITSWQVDGETVETVSKSRILSNRTELNWIALQYWFLFWCPWTWIGHRCTRVLCLFYLQPFFPHFPPLKIVTESQFEFSKVWMWALRDVPSAHPVCAEPDKGETDVSLGSAGHPANAPVPTQHGGWRLRDTRQPGQLLRAVS